MNSERHTVRVCEWAHTKRHGLSAEERRAICSAVDVWRAQNGLAVSPLSFGGPAGEELRARQFVGVVEVNNVVIEIFPKLDAALISGDDKKPISESTRLASVMQNLLWILHVANFR